MQYKAKEAFAKRPTIRWRKTVLNEARAYRFVAGKDDK